MSQSAPQLYTAAQIARATRDTRQAVQREQADVPPDKEDYVRGNLTRFWKVEKFSRARLSTIDTHVNRGGYRDRHHYLTSAGEAWTPAYPWQEIAAHCQEKAIKLRLALLPTLERLNDPLCSRIELERTGLEHFRRVMGQGSLEHFQRLLKRTEARDGGERDWDRRQIFLPDKLARRERPSAASEVLIDCAPLRAFLRSLKDEENPSAADRQLFWIHVCELHEQQVAAEHPAPSVKRTLLEFIEAEAAFVTATGDALRRYFDRKRAQWRASEGDAKALADRRADASGRFRAPAISEEDRDTFIMQATFCCGGRVDQTWRELCRDNTLSEALLSYYRNDTRHCPRKIREAVKHEIAMLSDLHHGPRQAKLNGPYIRRDWSKVFAGDWYQADDLTAPVYYLVPDGKGWFTLMRGQIIVMIDLRTTRILGFLLHSEQQYNARIIRSLITRVCTEHGLPRKGFYFEGGLWKRSRILVGDSAANEDECDWNQTELGLREFGLKFIHARLPRGKPVERVLGAVQNQMERDPGYVGRNEQVEKFERVQAAKIAVARKDESALAHFYTQEQWFDRFDEIARHYNAEPSSKESRMLRGMSPDDAAALLDDHSNPQPEFDASTLYLLANHRRPVQVKKRGIDVFGQRYYGPEIAHLIGRDMLAWYHPDTPEILCLTDRDRKNPIAIPRAAEPGADAADDILAAEQARADGHLSYAKTRYRVMAATFRKQRRQMVTDRDVVELGQGITHVTTQATETKKRTERAQRVAGVIGMKTLSPEAARLPETSHDLERLQKLLADDTEE